MPITGKFVADFTDFDRATTASTAKLLTFEKAADQAGGRLMDLEGHADTAAPSINTLSDTFRSFDGSLSALGVHIGPEIKALEEIGRAAGKTATEIGLLGAAGLALASGIGGWKLGRMAAELLGTDKILGDITAKLLGLTDAAERAGAKADVLALASKNAGRDITDFNEALKINREAADRMALQMGQTANATRDTNIQIAGFQREIREVRKEGNMEALTRDLDLQVLSLEQLRIKYGISTEALQYLQKSIAATAKEHEALIETQKRAQAEQDKMAASVRAFYNMVGEREIEQAKIVQDTAEREAAALRAFYNEMGVLEMNAWKPEPIVDWVEKVEESQAVMADTPPVAAAAADGVLSLGAAAQQAASSFFSMSAELYTAIRAAQAFDDLAGRNPGIYGSTIGGIAGSTPTTRYMGASTYLQSSGAMGVHVTINGSVLSNKDEIARVVGDAVTSSYRTSGQRLPV